MLTLYSLGKDLEEGLGKQNMKTRDEMAADHSLDGERTITYDYAANQEQDDGLEVESAMILPAMVEKEKVSDSETTLEGNSFGNITGHGYTHWRIFMGTKLGRGPPSKHTYFLQPLICCSP
jgi:hypothetical protein